MRILEEFWYGNIEPTEYDTSSCKEYKKLLELICRNEEKIFHHEDLCRKKGHKVWSILF